MSEENLDLDICNDYEDSGDTEIEDTSTETKIENLLGDDGEAPKPIKDLSNKEPEPEPIKEPPVLPDEYKVKVKIDGVEKEVSIDELKNGYSRQSDYTLKTQQLAQERQQVEAQQREYNQYLQSIPLLAQVAQNNINEASNQLYSKELVELAKTDPAEYVVVRAQIEATIAENQKTYQQMGQQYQEQQYLQQNNYTHLLTEVKAEANKILANEIPGWEDGSAQQQLNSYAQTYGFTQDELAQTFDYRQVQVLNKARMYDDLMKNKGAATKRVAATPPKSLTSNTSQQFEEQADFQKRKRAAIRSGSDRDIAAVLADLL